MSIKPIFIFSLPRSGSTLLQRILVSHPEIETISEPWFLIPSVYALRDSGVFAEYSAASLHKTMTHLISKLPNGKQDYYDGLRVFAETIYSRLNTKKAKYFLDKTPRYYLIIQEIEQIFPDAKFIFLFRNPLSTLSSLVDSFFGGNLGDYKHKIDIYKGPFMLADGYKALKDKSIAVHYENILDNPRETIMGICDYLSIGYSDSLVENFSEISLTGFGDQFGSKKYSRLEKAPVDKWKTVLGTKYRRNYASKYIRYLGEETIEIFGYNMDEPLSDLNQLNTKSTGGLKDRYNLLVCHLMTLFEVPMFKKKLKNISRLKEKYYIHF